MWALSRFFHALAGTGSYSLCEDFQLEVSALQNQSVTQAGQAERYGSLTRDACPNVPSKAIEDAARAALDLRAGRSLSDVEWARTRSRLLDFAAMLREWGQKAQNPEPKLGNVDAICQPET